MAAKVLKKPNLITKIGEPSVAIRALAAKIGVSLDEEPTFVGPLDLDADVFSQEQIEYLICDVYSSYLIGSKLLGSL